MKNFFTEKLLYLSLAFIMGAVTLIAVRFVTVKPNDAHYHANFAVFVDGERLPLDNFTYYEEVAACSSDDHNNPKSRVHMHEMESHLVHVHDSGATWGHFFANLGMTAGDTLFKTDKDTFVETKGKVVIRYLLNGEEVDTIANRSINSVDSLLVSIGNPSDDDIRNQYSQIEQDAEEHNEENDPLTCSGGSTYSFMDRLKIAVGLE